MKQKLSIAWEGRWFEVTLEKVPDEYDPHAVLSAVDDSKSIIAKSRVPANFKFNRDLANEWARGGFEEPTRSR